MIGRRKTAIIEEFSTSPARQENKNLIFRRFILLKMKKVLILRDFYYLSLLEVTPQGGN